MIQAITQQLKRLTDDERAVSPVVGFVLMFALVMILFTIYNADVVPAQNEGVEYEHSRMVEGQMEQLSAAFVSTGPEDPPKAVSLQLGVQYPNRVFGINPGTPVGSLNSTGPHTVGLSIGSGSEDFNTSFINYLPNYNMKTEETQYSIEHGMLVKDYSSSSATRLASPGALFSADGETVNLNLISGDVSASEMSTVVTTDNVDTHTINVTSDSATLTLPTTLEEDEWDRLLTDDSGDPIAQVDSYTYSSGSSEISIDLKNGTAVDLNKVSTGDPADDDEIDLDPQITNVTSLTPPVSTITNNSTTPLTVRTTDQFGNSLSDVDISIDHNGGGSLSVTNATSGGSGEATFAYDPDDSDAGNTVDVTASLPGQTGPNSSVTFELEYPPEESNTTSNETSREPLNVNNLQTGRKTLLKFKTTPGSPINVSGFSITTKSEASALNETGYTHQFQLTRSQRIRSVSSGNELRYASGEPIQFDGQDYTFIGGPRRVTSSEVILEGWQWAENVQINDFTDSYEDADIVVYLITENGKRPVYIDATVAGSSTSTASTSTTDNTTTSTIDTTTTDSSSTTTADTTTTTDSATTTETTTG